jgi:IS605 OrfB family transposase
VKLTAKVKLQPTVEQALLLRQTLETVNRACDYISTRGWETKTFNRFRLQKLTYSESRCRFSLTAQVVIRCLSKVADAYTLDRKHKRRFRPHGGIAYDNRILNWRMADRTVSIWCMGGRQIIPFVAGPRQLELLAHQQGETDLATIDGQWYLFAVCEVEEPAPGDVLDVLGVDLGVVNLAVDSDGNVHSSAQVNGLRHRHRRLRQKLQAKGTRAAKRLLKKRSGKEARFAADVNHTVSQRIVATAQGTGRGIALENLHGIRSRITARRPQRATLHSWSFFQLRSFIDYKARRLGVPLVLVDPRNTSRTCPACGAMDKANRVSQSVFSCVVCGFSGLADYIAALNIRVLGRAAVIRPYVSDARTTAQRQGQATPL